MCSVVFAEPRSVTRVEDCHFYHTMDLPGYGVVEGQWDLRGREADYLGQVSFQGKRVLEMGTASGHLCFTMEKMGAEVVAHDLSEEQEWDVVPYAGRRLDEEMSTRKDWVRRVNNSFWLAHRVFNSRAKVVYGTVYDIPEDIGRFDICTFGSILLHLRDPFLALQCATAHVDGTAIVTDVPIFPIGSDPVFNLLARHRFARFLPDAAARKPGDAWWNLSPALVSEFLRVLGFPYTKTTLHRQRYYGREIELYTVVGRRVAERDAAATDGEEGHEPIAFESEDRAGLEKTALDYMPFSRIAEYLVKRGWDAVGKRVFGRR